MDRLCLQIYWPLTLVTLQEWEVLNKRAKECVCVWQVLSFFFFFSVIWNMCILTPLPLIVLDTWAECTSPAHILRRGDPHTPRPGSVCNRNIWVQRRLPGNKHVLLQRLNCAFDKDTVSLSQTWFMSSLSTNNAGSGGNTATHADLLFLAMSHRFLWKMRHLYRDPDVAFLYTPLNKYFFYNTSNQISWLVTFVSVQSCLAAVGNSSKRDSGHSTQHAKLTIMLFISRSYWKCCQALSSRSMSLLLFYNI